jgi:hypothetical protein
MTIGARSYVHISLFKLACTPEYANDATGE